MQTALDGGLLHVAPHLDYGKELLFQLIPTHRYDTVDIHISKSHAAEMQQLSQQVMSSSSNDSMQFFKPIISDQLISHANRPAFSGHNHVV